MYSSRTLFLLLTITATATVFTIGLLMVDTVRPNQFFPKLFPRNYSQQSVLQSVFGDFAAQDDADEPKKMFDDSIQPYMNIDKLNCSTAAKLLIICFSAVPHFEHRQAVRETWGRVARSQGMQLFFLMGLPTGNSVAQNKVYEEDIQFGDILQTNFYDTYHNLTMKTIAMMRWVSVRECVTKNVHFVLKVDDDMLININELSTYIDSRKTDKWSFIGRVVRGWLPARNQSSKYYIPHEMYNGSVYPNFATGQAYLFTTDIAQPLYYESSLDNPSQIPYLEDVYISGMLADRLNITRVHHKSFVNQHTLVTNRNFARIWAAHGYKPNELRQRWQLVNRPIPKPKPRPKPKAKLKSKSKSKPKPKKSKV